MTNRLVVGGCSITDYCWPTWGDYLATAFDNYLNCGQAGSDNANIARNIIANTKAKDTVVILWSGWNRHVMWNTNKSPTQKNKDNYWEYNYSRWDKNWLVNFYNPTERLASSMDYIKMVDMDSQLKGYTAYHFSAFPWKLGEIEKNPVPNFDENFNRYQINNNFLLDTSMEDYYKLSGKNQPVSNKYNPRDLHPTPKYQYLYLSDIILPKLNIKLDIMPFVEKHESIVRAGGTIDDKSKQGLLQ